MNMDFDFYISETELYSDVDDNYQYTINNKKMKLYDYLETIINSINNYKPLNDQQQYYIQNMASTTDKNIIINTYNNVINNLKFGINY